MPSIPSDSRAAAVMLKVRVVPGFPKEIIRGKAQAVLVLLIWHRFEANQHPNTDVGLFQAFGVCIMIAQGNRHDTAPRETRGKTPPSCTTGR